MDEEHVVLEIYKKGHEAADKFNYFVCGIAGAVFAYDAQNYVPRKIGLDFYSLEPLSLFLLALSFYFGFKRIESSRTCTLMNHSIADGIARAKEISQQLQNGSKIYNFAGEVRNPNDVQKERENLVHKVKKWQSNLEAEMLRAALIQRWRDWLLIAGFAAIFLAKVLQPYEMNDSSHRNAINRQSQLPSQTKQTSATQNTIPLSTNPQIEKK